MLLISPMRRLFLISAVIAWPHRMEALPPASAEVTLSILGIACTLAAGWFGWRLVQTHHVGVELTPEQERIEPLVLRPTHARPAE